MCEERGLVPGSRAIDCPTLCPSSSDDEVGSKYGIEGGGGGGGGGDGGGGGGGGSERRDVEEARLACAMSTTCGSTITAKITIDIVRRECGQT